MQPSHEKKDDILNAAGGCFARYGFEKTTMDDIGRAVGLNKASLYYYFNNKEAIFTEVIFQEREKYLKNLIERTNREKNRRDQIAAYMVGRYRFVFDYLNLHNLSSEILLRIRPFFFNLYESVVNIEIDLVKNFIEQGIEGKEFRACDAKRIAASIITVCDAIKQRECVSSELKKVKEYDNERIEEEIAFICSLILDGIKR